MKTIIKFSLLVFSFFLLPTVTSAQIAKDTTIIVNGVCQMCQFTIESTSLKVDGVESAAWDVESKVLKLTFDPEVTSLQSVNNAILASGYDTEYDTATDEAYYGLHKCCYYRDPQVVEDHKKQDE